MVIAIVSRKTICDFSGKGINVSLALTQLGMPVKSVCLSHSDGEAADFFKQRDMDAELIPVPGNVRINIKLFETIYGLHDGVQRKRALLYIPKLPWMLFALSKMFCPQHRC